MKPLPLRDIHLPDAISWWPLAIGWWLLPLFILGIGYVIYRFIKIRQQKQKVAYRSFALAELNKLRKQYKNDDNSIDLLRAISALLRRTALSYLPRESIASLTGEQWFTQLNALSSQQIFTPEVINLLEHAPYKQNSEFNKNQLFNVCEQWIKALPVTRTHKTSLEGAS